MTSLDAEPRDEPPLPPHLCIIPDPITAVREYLLSVPQVTTITDRIVTVVPKDPIWPLIRLTLLTSFQVFARRYDRCLFQVDCFATAEPAAHELARVVRAALQESENWQSAEAVLGGTTDSSIRPMPETGYTPPIARYAVSAHVFIHPNP